jgi:hypothetical protein
MCIVAQAALLEHGGLVGVDLRKTSTLMTIETAAFEDKPSTSIQFVALGALHAGNGRMLVKRLKSRWRIRANKEVHFLFAALPQQSQRVQARRRLQRGMKHIWKGLFGLDQVAIELEFSRRRGGNQIDLPVHMG